MVEQQRNPVISQSKAPEILSSILTVLNMKQELSSSSSPSSSSSSQSAAVGVFQTQHPRQHFDNFFASKSKLDAAAPAASNVPSTSTPSTTNTAATGKYHAMGAAPVAASGPIHGAGFSRPASTSPPVKNAETAPNLLPCFPAIEGSSGMPQTEDDDNNNNHVSANCNYENPAGSRSV